MESTLPYMKGGGGLWALICIQERSEHDGKSQQEMDGSTWKILAILRAHKEKDQ